MIEHYHICRSAANSLYVQIIRHCYDAPIVCVKFVSNPCFVERERERGWLFYFNCVVAVCVSPSQCFRLIVTFPGHTHFLCYTSDPFVNISEVNIVRFAKK